MQAVDAVQICFKSATSKEVLITGKVLQHMFHIRYTFTATPIL